MSRMQGRFYFKLTANGNLLGEYSNNDCSRSFPESASRFPAGNLFDGYEGSYISTWYEEGQGRAFSADMSIIPKHGCVNIFTVNWRPRPGDISSTQDVFFGEAMLADNMLVGNYQMVPRETV